MSRALFITCFLWLTPAQALSPIAEVICAPSPQMTAKLTRQFGTSRTATGLRNPEEIVEIWTDDNGDWTMVIAYASGKSCIVAMGAHWQDVSPENPV